MTIHPDVLSDLLPLYAAGEASAATRALVEEGLARDPELAARLRALIAEDLRQLEPAQPPPALELTTIRRTRLRLRQERWMLAAALALSAVGSTFEFSTRNGRFNEAHFLARDHPFVFGGALAVGVVCWILYALLRRQSRVAGF